MIALILLIASQVDVTTTLPPRYQNKSLTIGDPFEITVTITHPAGASISELFADSLGSFMILEQKNKTVQEKGAIRNTYTMSLAAFATGEMELPRFKVLYTHADTVDTISSSVAGITIQSVLPEDMTDINDIKKAVTFPNFLPLIIAGIVIGCALLAYALYRIVKGYLRRRTEKQPLSPPWIEAIAAINTIPIQEWRRKGRIKNIYYALSEILKRYMERRFIFNAAEQTTSELVSTMKAMQIPLRDEFYAFFARADMVKYAKFIPPDSELHSAVQTARDLVNNTTPEDQEVSP